MGKNARCAGCGIEGDTNQPFKCDKCHAAERAKMRQNLAMPGTAIDPDVVPWRPPYEPCSDGVDVRAERLPVRLSVPRAHR